LKQCNVFGRTGGTRETSIVNITLEMQGRSGCRVGDRGAYAHLCNLALHDKKVWVVDVELHRLENGLDDVLLRLMSIEEVL
jgi:hypothetical protein